MNPEDNNVVAEEVVEAAVVAPTPVEHLPTVEAMQAEDTVQDVPAEEVVPAEDRTTVEAPQADVEGGVEAEVVEG